MPLPGGPVDQHRAAAQRDAADIGNDCDHATSAHAAGSPETRQAPRSPSGDPRRSGCRHALRQWCGRWRGRGRSDCRNSSPSGRCEWKRRKTFSRSASGMPGPSSHTVRLTRSSVARDRHDDRPPSGENDTALSSRFSAIRSSRMGTPITTSLPVFKVDLDGAAAILAALHLARRPRWRQAGPVRSARTSRGSVRHRSGWLRKSRVTSRSIRRTSCAAMSTSCARRSGSSTLGSDSVALRRDASGFLISCATSAAKVSTASIRWRSVAGHVRHGAGQQADLVARARAGGALPLRVRGQGAPATLPRTRRRNGCDDGARQIQRKQGRNRQRQQDDRHQAAARIAHGLR